MKKSFLSLCLLASLMTVFNGCSKDDTPPPPPPPATTNFNPLTTGSNWTYKHTQTGIAPYNFTLTVTARDTTANGKKYKVLSNSSGTNAYIAQVGSDDYRYASFPSTEIPSFEELFLKEDKGVNETWTNSVSVNVSGLPLAATLKYVIKGKGESRTVNGKAFTNVTHVRVDISILLVGSIGGGDFYYQEGVGLIEDTIAITQPVAYSAKDEIVSYEIK